MNLFDIADAKKAEVESTRRAGKVILDTTVKLPHMQVGYRRGKAYTLNLLSPKQGRKKQTKIEHTCKPLAGTFMIALAINIAFDTVEAMNYCLADQESEDFLTLNCFHVEAVCLQEGFEGISAKRVATHIKDCSEKYADFPISVDEQFNIEIEKHIVKDVLQAV